MKRANVYSVRGRRPVLNRKSGLALAASLVGLALISMALYGYYERYRATHGVAQPPDSSTVDADEALPSELKPDLGSVYNVPAGQPRLIRIPSIKVEGFVQKVSHTNRGAVAAPTNIHFAGWYVDAALPGQPGLSIIDGHVSGRYASGIFKRLKEIKKGEVIEIEFGDKTLKRFSVLAVESTPEAEAAEKLFTKQADVASQLNLITCGGSFSKANQTYAERVVVTTQLIQ